MRSLRLIVVVLAVLLTCAASAAASAPQPQSRIIGGTDAAAGAWPAHVYVTWTIGGMTHYCGGTLVSARWVLTAAHCVSNAGNEVPLTALHRLRMNSVDRNSGGFEATADDIIRHPDFSDPPGPNGVPTHDLALLHLAETAPVDPVPLIAGDAADAGVWSPGTVATIVGWGYTQNAGPMSDELQQAQVPIVTDAACAQPAAWGTLFNASTMLCAGGSTTDSCSGDSGGPLMVPRLGLFTLVGVTSWGSDPCAKPDVPGVYVRLGDPAINAWVKRHVPTIAFTVSPAAPVAGAPVTFTAAPGPVGGTPAVSWDTDGDGDFDDASGPSASTVFPAAASYIVGVRADYPDVGDRSAIRRDAVAVAAPPPPPPPPPPPAPPPPPPPPPPFAAKLEVARASVSRAARRLSVLAPITGRASGRLRAALQAGGRTERFRATIDASRRRVRINRRIPAAQANVGSGILTLTYAGDSDTQPQEVRLRAAARRAALEASRPRIVAGRLTAGGELSRLARGVVRLQLLFEPAGEDTRTVELTAPIRNGRYRFNVALPADVREAIAQRRGVVHSYTLFTGYLPARIRGEMHSFEVLGAR